MLPTTAAPLLADAWSISIMELLGYLACFADMLVGPISVVFVIVALTARAGFKRSLRVTAVLNLVVACLCLQLGELIEVFLVQAFFSVALLIVLAAPRTAEFLFGAPSPPPPPPPHGHC